jgi:hypothetical protein
VNSDFLQGENPRSPIGQRQHWCIASFLEVLLLINLFYGPVAIGAWLTWELLLLQSPAMAPEKLLDGV